MSTKKKSTPPPQESATLPPRAKTLNGWLALCVPLVQASEGCRLDAYPDPATGGAPWTIGWGCTGDYIKKGTTWTQEQADAELIERLERIGRAIDKVVTVELVPQMKAALADFCYNLGTSAFEGSTLRRMLNAGSYKGAAMQLQYWIHAAGHVLPGLQIRRARERDLFLTGTWQ